MFTIKYVYPSGQEHISGPYRMVTSEWVDQSGNHVDPRNPRSQQSDAIYRVVYAYEQEPEGGFSNLPSGFGAAFTCGPNIPAAASAGDPLGQRSDPHSYAKVFVMNEHGATVAKYDL